MIFKFKRSNFRKVSLLNDCLFKKKSLNIKVYVIVNVLPIQLPKKKYYSPLNVESTGIPYRYFNFANKICFN